MQKTGSLFARLYSFWDMLDCRLCTQAELVQEIVMTTKSNLAGFERIEYFIFDDKPHSLPVTALVQTQVTTHVGTVRTRTHLCDNASTENQQQQHTGD